MLFWDDGSSTANRLMERLGAEGIRVHPITRMLPGFDTDRSPYILNELDRYHPNSHAHGLIAAYVAERIIERDRR